MDTKHPMKIKSLYSTDPVIKRHQISMDRKLVLNRAASIVFNFATLGMLRQYRTTILPVQNNLDAINARVRELRAEHPIHNIKLKAVNFKSIAN